jgi:hypothetical protein
MEIKKDRSRLWNVLLYPDDPTHVKAMELIRASFNYVAICHDKDLDDDGNIKKVHYHCILKFSQARWNSSLSDELGITANYMQKTGDWDRAAKYLLHEGCDNKHLYDIAELEGPLSPAVQKVLANDDENCRVLQILEMVDSIDAPISVSNYVYMCCQKGLYADCRRLGVIGMNILQEHNARFNRPSESEI